MNKSILKTNTSRRNFLGGTAATVALTAGVGTPWIAQAASNVKIGLIHPATGWAAYPAAQLRYGAQMAIADINAAGGIKSMGGAQLEALLGDSQTKPEIGAAEVEKMNEAGVHAIQGCYQSAISATWFKKVIVFLKLSNLKFLCRNSSLYSQSGIRFNWFLISRDVSAFIFNI